MLPAKRMVPIQNAGCPRLRYVDVGMAWSSVSLGKLWDEVKWLCSEWLLSKVFGTRFMSYFYRPCVMLKFRFMKVRCKFAARGDGASAVPRAEACLA